MTAITERPDVIVVGAGAGGPVVAKDLAERGVRVLVLEAGPWLDPDRDYSLLEHDMNGLVDGRFRWGPGDRSRSPWVRRRENVGLIWQTAGVGGSTLHYNGISTRAFRANVDEKWPLTYDDLVPYYERVEDFLPVHLVSDLATKDALFAAGCEKIGLERSESRDVTGDMWRPCHNAILPIARMANGPFRYPEVEGCTMCGHCLSGCPNPQGAPIERKAKRATNVSYVPAAIGTGNCEVVSDAFATAVLFDPPSDGKLARARGIRWRETETGEDRESEADVVVLAGGSIENPRLWLNSGLPNSHDAVGRRLTTHYQDLVTGFFDRDVNPYQGQVTMARADLPGHGTFFTQGLGPQAYAVAMSTGLGFWDEATGSAWDTQGRCWGPELSRRMAEYPRSLSVILSVNDESDPDNRVTLADDWPADEHGPVPKIIYYPSEKTVQRQAFLAAKATEVLKAAGAHAVHKTNIGVLLTHIMGTMRMGHDPAVSVVDADCRAHEVERLYVADTSVVPSVGGANPTLTAQALAARTADRIASRYFS